MLDKFNVVNSNNLSTVIGGNRAGGAVVAALGCASGGVKIGSAIAGPWGAGIGGVGGALVCGYIQYNAN